MCCAAVSIELLAVGTVAYNVVLSLGLYVQVVSHADCIYVYHFLQYGVSIATRTWELLIAS